MDARIECKLFVFGESKSVKEFKQRLEGIYPTYQIGHGCPSCRIELEPTEPEKHPLCFNNTIPVPETKLAQGYPKAGMYWEINNWGVKWGAVDDTIIEETENSVTYAFWTPSAPPRKWVSITSKTFPKLRFSLAYFGEECLPFWGIETYIDGKRIAKVEIPAQKEERDALFAEEWKRATSPTGYTETTILEQSRV